ncbi:MAG: hypothetical protein R3E13_10475 [Alphaproteobacteria bacterium]
MANQFLGLSLFIMLLSFFIILNAISSFETTKTQPVLNSLSMAFSNKDAVEDIMPGKMLAETAEMQSGSTLDRIEAVFKSQITAAETRQNRLGTTMYVHMPFEDFKRGIMKSIVIPDLSDVRSAAVPMDLLPMLVSLMETSRDTAYTMDMILNIEENPAVLWAKDPEGFSALNKSISAIAAKLEEAGLPKYQVTAGLKQGKTGFIDIIFRRYVPFSPLDAQNAIPEQPSRQEEAAP